MGAPTPHFSNAAGSAPQAGSQPARHVVGEVLIVASSWLFAFACGALLANLARVNFSVAFTLVSLAVAAGESARALLAVNA